MRDSRQHSRQGAVRIRNSSWDWVLCFGQAITGSHTVSIVGLAIIVLSGWLD